MNSPYTVAQLPPEYWSATEWIQLPLVLIMGTAFWSLQKQPHSVRNWKASWKTVAGYPRSPVGSWYRILYDQELKITNKKSSDFWRDSCIRVLHHNSTVLGSANASGLVPPPPDHSGFSQPSTSCLTDVTLTTWGGTLLDTLQNWTLWCSRVYVMCNLPFLITCACKLRYVC